MRDFDLALRVLVHGERVDHANRVALLQVLERSDDLAVELGLAEADHEQLNRSDGHSDPFVVWLRSCRAGGGIASSDQDEPGARGSSTRPILQLAGRAVAYVG